MPALAARQEIAGRAATETRRYTFKLYPTAEQAAVLHEHRHLVAALWNGLLERWEEVYRRTQQRQEWTDARGKRHRGLTIHSPTWISERYEWGENAVMRPGKDGRPKPFTGFDMQNECTWAANDMPELRAMSVWCLHRTATQLSRAIDAFYRRAKVGEPAGYPRYRSAYRHDSIPHRFASGLKLTAGATPWSWRLAVKGVATPIRARGIFPGAPEKLTDADIIWRAGVWWLSVCVEIPARRTNRGSIVGDSHLRFDLIDCLAIVDGYPSTPEGFRALPNLAAALDRAKSESGRRWPRGRKIKPEERAEFVEASAEIAKLSAYMARIRRDALHKWTTGIVEHASSLTIVKPASIREAIQSGRGNVWKWGSQAAAVAEVNRSVLSAAPAMAIEMLRYKAAETGIPCEIVADDAPAIAIGREMVVVGKNLRRARRELKKAAA